MPGFSAGGTMMKRSNPNLPNSGASFAGLRPGLGRAGVTKMLSLVGKGGGTKSNTVFMMNQVGRTGRYPRRNWGGVSQLAPAPAPPAPATPAPTPTLTEHFKTFDKDGDEQWNKEEFTPAVANTVHAVLEEVGSELNHEDKNYAIKAITDKLFKETDTDYSGAVDLEEHYARFDKDGDGIITLDEVSKATNETALELFDVDGDGNITSLEVFLNRIADQIMVEIDSQLECHPIALKDKIKHDIKKKLKDHGVGKIKIFQFNIHMNNFRITNLAPEVKCDECHTESRVHRRDTGELDLGTKLLDGVTGADLKCISLNYNGVPYHFFPIYSVYDDLADLENILSGTFDNNCAAGVPAIIASYDAKYIPGTPSIMYLDIPSVTPDCPITSGVYLANHNMRVYCDMHKCQTLNSCLEVELFDHHLSMAKPGDDPQYVCMSDLFEGKHIKGLLTFTSYDLTVVLLSPPETADSY